MVYKLKFCGTFEVPIAMFGFDFKTNTAADKPLIDGRVVDNFLMVRKTQT